MNSKPEVPPGPPPASDVLPSTQPLGRRVLSLPRARAGWWSVGLALAFFVLLGVSTGLAAMGQPGGDTFLANQWLSLTMLAAASAALAGAVCAAVAIFRKGERSLLVIGALLLGLLLLVFVLGEM